MTNCEYCGRWGIVDSDFKDVYMYNIDGKLVCEFCLPQMLQEKKIEVTRALNKLNELQMKIDLLKLERGD